MTRRSRTSTVKELRIRAAEIVRMVGTAEIAVAGEDVRVAVVVVVAGAADAEGVAGVMAGTGATGAAEDTRFKTQLLVFDCCLKPQPIFSCWLWN